MLIIIVQIGFEDAPDESPLQLPQSSATGSCQCAGTSCGCCDTVSVLIEKKTGKFQQSKMFKWISK